jgi:hypothetical protein
LRHTLSEASQAAFGGGRDYNTEQASPRGAFGTFTTENHPVDGFPGTAHPRGYFSTDDDAERILFLIC